MFIHSEMKLNFGNYFINLKYVNRLIKTFHSKNELLNWMQKPEKAQRA